MDQKAAASVASHCFVSVFGTDVFEPLAEGTGVSVSPFVRSQLESEPPIPLSWVDFKLATARRTRSVRLTCRDIDKVALRQWEAYPTNDSFKPTGYGTQR